MGSREQIEGRRIVTIVIVSILGMTLIRFLTILWAPPSVILDPMSQSDRVRNISVRMLLSVGLCFAMYRGANWARHVTIWLLVAGGISGLFAGVDSALTGRFDIVALALLYLGCAGVLMTSDAVRCHFGAFDSLPESPSKEFDLFD